MTDQAVVPAIGSSGGARPDAGTVPLWRSATLLAGGTAIGQLIAVALTPLITRLYDPHDFGVYGLYTAFIGFASVAVSLRYETAIIAATSRVDAARLAIVSCVLSLVVGALASVALTAFIWLRVLGFGGLPIWSAPLAMGSLSCIGIVTTLRYWLLRSGDFRSIARLPLVQNGGRAVAQLALGLPRAGSAGLFVGDLLGRALGLRALMKASLGSILSDAGRVGARDVREVCSGYRRFPLLVLPSAAVNALTLSAPVPVITQLHGVVAGGHMALVLQVFALPLALVGASVADAFHSHFAELVRTQPAAAPRAILATAGRLLLVGAGPGAALALFGPPAFAFVFGAGWRTAGVLAGLMAPWALAQLVVSPVSRAVLVIGGEATKLVYDLASLVGVASVYLLSRHFRLSLLQSVGALSAVNVLAYSIYFSVLMSLACRVRRQGKS